MSHDIQLETLDHYGIRSILNIVCIGVSPLNPPTPHPCPSKTPRLFFTKPFLKSANCPSPSLNLQTVQVPPFQAIPFYILFFCEPPCQHNTTHPPSPHKKKMHFSYLILPHFLKVTKFLVKISQFKFLVMT